MRIYTVKNYILTVSVTIANLVYVGGEIAGKVLEVGTDVKTISEVQL
jgi:hypothetical protein